MLRKIKLGVNIDHIATLRNARGEHHPSVLRAAQMAFDAGADGITVHLREDRRHIKDRDVYDVKKHINLPLNLECAATDEMLEIALEVIPNACCLVPEKRAELTTDGGLDVIKNFNLLKNFSKEISKKGILPSFFIDSDIEQLKAAKEAGAKIVEFHTGKYCRLVDEIHPREGGDPKPLDSRFRGNESLVVGGQTRESIELELSKLRKACEEAEKLGIVCHAGHGLNYNSIPDVVKIPQIVELNIGHFIIGESVFVGLPEVLRKVKGLMNFAI